jgi:L-ascorbate metabolism protein UlaG (beta-lactamase superfamily)
MKRSGAAGCAPAGAGPPNPVVALPFLLRRARASFAPRRGAAPAVPFDARAIERNPVATWIGHATFLVRMDTAAFLTDPVWSERASPVSFAGPKRIVPPGVPSTRSPASTSPSSPTTTTTTPICPPSAASPSWACAALDLGARAAVGMHFGTFDLSDEPLDEPPRRFLAEARARGLGDRAFLMAVGETRGF